MSTRGPIHHQPATPRVLSLPSSALMVPRPSPPYPSRALVIHTLPLHQAQSHPRQCHDKNSNLNLPGSRRV